MKASGRSARTPDARASRRPAPRRRAPDGAHPAPAAAGGLADRVVLVTGASSGIGAAIAQALASAGARPILMGRSRQRLARVPAAAPGAPAAAIVRADFEKPGELRRAVAEVRRLTRRLGAIVHAAGAFDASRLTRAPRGQFARLAQINVQAAIDLTVGLLPILDERADIVFINSSVVQRPTADAAYYAASKHALRALADSLREEVNARGVRVTSLFPGRTATPMQQRIVRREGRAYRPERLIQPADIASAVCAVLALPATVEVTELFLRPALPPLR